MRPSNRAALPYFDGFGSKQFEQCRKEQAKPAGSADESAAKGGRRGEDSPKGSAAPKPALYNSFPFSRSRAMVSAMARRMNAFTDSPRASAWA